MRSFRTRKSDYHDSDFSEFMIQKVLNFKKNFGENRSIDSNNLKILTTIGLLADNSRILDIGGSAGTHYYLAKTIYPKKRFEWRILENKTIVNQLKHFPKDCEVKYFAEYENAVEDFQPNLIILSSTIQYLDDPIKELNRLTSLEAEFILVTKTPMSMENSKQIIQKSDWNSNGPGSYPWAKENFYLRTQCEVISFKDFCKLLSKNYKVYISFDEGSFKYSRFKKAFPYKSFLFISNHSIS